MQARQSTSGHSRRRMLLLGGAALVCTGAAGVLTYLQSGTPGDRNRCAENLRVIGQACITYASANRGDFPRSLKELMYASGGALRPDQMTCPNAGKKGRGGDYVYVPGYRQADDPNSILVYEPLGNHKKKPGGHVLLLGGTVNWLDENEHKAAIARITTR